MDLLTLATMAIIHLPRLYMLGVVLPSGISTTLTNFMTAGQVIGFGMDGVILVIAGIQISTGGRNAVEMGKTRLIVLCVGLVLIGGCSVIKTFVEGLLAF
jgi:hypothetical protein